MDITVVSLLPWAVCEIKPGLIPEVYQIPAAGKDKPAVLHIKDGRSNLYVRDGKTYPITHPAEEVANALIEDYVSAMLQTSEDARPAIFWVMGHLKPEEVLAKHKAEIEAVKYKQGKWFMALIRLADDDWERTHQHKMITDIQRHAARSMGLLTKPWMQNIEPEEFVRCAACSTLVNVEAAICPNCKFVTNPAKAKELGLAK